MTYSQAVNCQAGSLAIISSQIHVPEQKSGHPSHTAPSPKPKDGPSDKRFNIIIQGIVECPLGTSTCKSVQVSNDIKNTWVSSW